MEPPPEEPPDEDEDGGCTAEIDGPKFLAVNAEGQFGLNVDVDGGGIDAISWAAPTPAGLVEADPDTMTQGTLVLTALDDPGTVTLSATVTTSEGEQCMADFEFEVVGPACGPNQPVTPVYVRVPGLADCGSAEGNANFGVTSVETSFWEAEFAACAGEDGDWHLRVVSFTSTYGMEVCPTGRIEVFTAWDPIVTAPSYCDILVDFTPFGGALPAIYPAAPYNEYFATNCVTQHEQAHVDEWEQTFNTGWMTGWPGQGIDAFEAQLESIAVPISIDTLTPDAAVQAMQVKINETVDAVMLDAISNWPGHATGPGGADESTAYPVENACLEQQLTTLIENRAAAEGWPPCNP